MLPTILAVVLICTSSSAIFHLHLYIINTSVTLYRPGFPTRPDFEVGLVGTLSLLKPRRARDTSGCRGGSGSHPDKVLHVIFCRDQARLFLIGAKSGLSLGNSGLSRGYIWIKRSLRLYPDLSRLIPTWPRFIRLSTDKCRLQSRLYHDLPDYLRPYTDCPDLIPTWS